MLVLIILFGSLLVFRAIGLAGVAMWATWLASARAALAAMFLFTAVSHLDREGASHSGMEHSLGEESTQPRD